LYNQGLEIPSLFKIFNSSDQSAKLLNNKDIEEDVKKEFIKLGLDTSLFTNNIVDYINLNTKFGYNKYNIFKYNKQLALYLQEKGYRIDEQKVER
jgi:hypothetical protein